MEFTAKDFSQVMPPNANVTIQSALVSGIGPSHTASVVFRPPGAAYPLVEPGIVEDFSRASA